MTTQQHRGGRSAATDGAAVYPLPLTSAGVTAPWLTQALRTRYPDAEVRSLEVLDVIEGTATKLKVRLDVTGAEVPSVLWVKGGFAEHRELVGASGVYEGEVQFFNHFAPLYDVHVPASYLGVAQHEPVQGIVLLEDLGAHDVTFWRSTVRCAPEQAAAGLAALADLHGQSWADPRVIEGTKLSNGDESQGIFELWLGEIGTYFAAPRAFAGSVRLHDGARLAKAMAAYRVLVQREPHCLLHGDAHVGNSYLESNGTVGFVDWQTVSHGSWVQDVNYFLVSALDVADRAAHEQDLLRGYLARLGSYPGVVEPSFDDAYETFRRATVYGLLCWLCNPDSWQPEDVNTATYARFAAAAIDHDTFARLGV